MAKSLLEESSPSEAEKYIENTNIVKNSDSTEKEKVFAQGVLDLLKPIDQGGNMSMNDYSNMMQEVDKKMAKKEKRVQRKGGGSMLNPPERETYQLGSVVKILTKGATALIKKATESLPKKETDRVIRETEKKLKREADLTPEQRADRIMEGEADPGGYEGQRDIGIEYLEATLTEDPQQGIESSLAGARSQRGLPEETIIFKIEELHKVRDEINDPDQYEIYLGSLIEEKVKFEDTFVDAQFKRQQEGELAAETAAYKEFEPDDIDIDPDDLPPSSTAEGVDLPFLPEKVSREANEVTDEQGRRGLTALGIQPREDYTHRQAGGSIMVPPEIEDIAVSEVEIPEDTYPNIPPQEIDSVEASQLPDEEMEDDYVDFVMSEALDPEEQTYLMNALEADPQLSMIFDKVVDTASEFSGAGEVSGPGTGVSDSIPARLSDGEFVVTKKATDQLGADNLQSLMDEAERAFDGGLMKGDSGIEDEEIKKSMVASNQMPSLNVRQR